MAYCRHDRLAPDLISNSAALTTAFDLCGHEIFLIGRLMHKNSLFDFFWRSFYSSPRNLQYVKLSIGRGLAGVGWQAWRSNLCALSGRVRLASWENYFARRYRNF